MLRLSIQYVVLYLLYGRAQASPRLDTPLVDNTLYIQLVGILLYLTNSIPELSYAVGAISRFMHKPHELHWKVVKNILWYVQGTITFVIHYATDSTIDLIWLTDSNWASNNTNRKSTYGYSLSLGFRHICWSRKKQVVISLSSIKAEYRGVVNITIQAMWLENFLNELGIQFH